MAIKEQIGIVTSVAMQKTSVVNIENKYIHPTYSKIVTKTKKYLVHDEKQISKIGDLVVIQECRPLSRNKRWTLTKILSTSPAFN
jgi:small subunit ribosomal protein S17